MRGSRRLRSLAAALAKTVVVLVALILLLVIVAIAAIETGWGKNQLRSLIVRQANQYLTATLDIGRLEGSLFRGIELGDITLSRDGKAIVSIENVALSYSPRELYENGTSIRTIRLTRPRILIAREHDGRWNLAALVRREARQEERTGPLRPIHLRRIEIVDGTVTLKDPLEFGAAHVPGHFNELNTVFSFDYEPVKWKLSFERVSWTGEGSDLTVTNLHGGLERGSAGWLFDNLSVNTPRSGFVLSGRIDRKEGVPTVLDLRVHADRFAFQEWSGVLRGLRNIAVDANFDTALHGPVHALATDLRLAGTGGSVDGSLVLDTTVPGWHGEGTVDVARLNLARWLNRSDRPSDITGRVAFNLALELGRRFPRGKYSFDGAHASYMGYAGDNVRARGGITAKEVLIAQASAIAYGANVTTRSGSIGIDDPFPFRFAGTATGVDLRQVPRTVPVPHVESLLAFDYDVSGSFSNPFIIGHAQFASSEFLGAKIGAGAVGSIDTLSKPLTYSGEGDLENINLRRFGEGLEVRWMQDPRYAGTVSGRFHVRGTGTGSATLRLTGGGRISHAELFGGRITDSEVTIDIAEGSMRTSYDGRFTSVDPAIALADRRFAASLSGSASVTTNVRDLMTRTPALGDYDIDGTLALESSIIRGFHVDRGAMAGSLSDGMLTLSRLDATGPAMEAHATGTVSFVDDRASNLEYDVVRASLSELKSLTGQDASGQLTTKGRLDGPWSALHLAGNANLTGLKATGPVAVDALTAAGTYDLTIPEGRIVDAQARVEGETTFVTMFGQTFQRASGNVSYDHQRVGFDLQILQQQGRNGHFTGVAIVRTDRREVEFVELVAAFGDAPWRLASSDRPRIVSWNDEEIAVSPLVFLGGAAGDQRIEMAGTWRSDGRGGLRVTARHVFLETLAGAFEQPPRYGGVIDLDATISGTHADPVVTGQITVSEGRIRRFVYQRLSGRIEYTRERFSIDLRMDQAPGVWITAKGTVPLSLFRRDMPEEALDVTVQSSSIGLGLLEGLTDVVREVDGQLRVNMKAIGTSRDPHFDGSIDIANATFLVTATGVRYKNTRGQFRLATDRVSVEMLHVEDSSGRALEVHGSLGTHELRVGELEIDGEARRFEVIRNEFGRLTVDTTLHVRGAFEAPRVEGDITINAGQLNVDRIIERALFQPYSTEPASIVEVDAVAALNPWNRLHLDLSVHVPNTLRLVGENVQISPGTPIGLGDINLRVGGDVYLYKDPGQQLFVTGSLYSISGTYVFQGRRFDIDETASSINFRGDLNPDVYVTVRRVISGVSTRVTISGPLRSPELRLSSTPPLDAAEILSLIVFNTSVNQLTAAQQQELAVRAGALAAGFLAAPIVAAIQNELGIDTLEIEPGDFGAGARVTVGEEIAPGLVARFSRQFGPEPYDEATIEYYLSRLLRLRATFSDATTINTRSPFRRVERAGVDLLFFFSF